MKVQAKETETEQRKTNETKSWILLERHNTRPPARSGKKSDISLIQNKKSDVPQNKDVKFLNKILIHQPNKKI